MKPSHFLYFTLLLLVAFMGCRANSGANKNVMPAPTINLSLAAADDMAKPGAVWFAESEKTAAVGSTVTADIYVNTGTQKLAAYTITLTYDANILALDTTFGSGNTGVDKGKDGFTTAINTTVSGKITISSFDVYGKGPSANLHLLTIKWTAKNPGTSYLTSSVINLNDEQTGIIGSPMGYAAKIEVTN